MAGLPLVLVRRTMGVFAAVQRSCETFMLVRELAILHLSVPVYSGHWLYSICRVAENFPSYPRVISQITRGQCAFV